MLIDGMPAILVGLHALFKFPRRKKYPRALPAGIRCTASLLGMPWRMTYASLARSPQEESIFPSPESFQ